MDLDSFSAGDRVGSWSTQTDATQSNGSVEEARNVRRLTTPSSTLPPHSNAFPDTSSGRDSDADPGALPGRQRQRLRQRHQRGRPRRAAGAREPNVAARNRDDGLPRRPGLRGGVPAPTCSKGARGELGGGMDHEGPPWGTRGCRGGARDPHGALGGAVGVLGVPMGY